MRLPTLALATLGLLNLVNAEDARLGPLKDLNGYFPFPAPKSVQEWEPRRPQGENPRGRKQPQ